MPVISKCSRDGDSLLLEFNAELLAGDTVEVQPYNSTLKASAMQVGLCGDDNGVGEGGCDGGGACGKMVAVMVVMLMATAMVVAMVVVLITVMVARVKMTVVAEVMVMVTAIMR